MTKIKGSFAERELVHMFWDAGWACVRVAGSGSSRFPSPDLLAGNGLQKLAIECKSTKHNRQYFTTKEISELAKFSEKFGAQAFVGIRFDRKSWYFLTLGDIELTKENFVVSLELAKQKGILFKELILL